MTIEFDKSIYAEKAVKKAIEDYASIAEIKLTYKSESCVCSIFWSKYPIEKTALEFSNYVLNLSVMSERKV